MTKEFDPMTADAKKLAKKLIDKMDKSVEPDTRLWPKMLADLVDVLSEHFAQRGHPDDAAFNEAQAVILALAGYFGGRMLYLPRDTRLRLALRDNLIWQQFNGCNVRQLGERYNLTDMQIYNILREQRQLHQKKYQMNLFQDG